jgi:hypothetical protein
VAITQLDSKTEPPIGSSEFDDTPSIRDDGFNNVFSQYSKELGLATGEAYDRFFQLSHESRAELTERQAIARETQQILRQYCGRKIVRESYDAAALSDIAGALDDRYRQQAAWRSLFTLITQEKNDKRLERIVGLVIDRPIIYQF